MKAFLSHSSNDKSHVSRVATKLGLAQVEYDQHTFSKAVLNVEAIIEALNRADLFVLFLSKKSIASNFVEIESRLALENLAGGKLNQILILCLDDDAFNLANKNLKKFNIVRKSVNIGSSYRYIQSALTKLRISHGVVFSPFVGREKILKEIKLALIAPIDEAPIALAISGIPGSGRHRTIERAVSEIFPNSRQFQPEINVQSNFTASDIYFELLGETGRVAIREAAEALKAFNSFSEDKKISELVRLIREISEAGEILHINDLGGLIQDSGEYHSAITGLLEKAKNWNKLSFVFIQNRVNPMRVKNTLRGIVQFIRINPLTDSDAKELIAAWLTRKNISFTSKELSQLASLVDNHPVNIEQVVQLIEEQNISLVLKDTNEISTWKLQRAQSFINSISFTKDERLIIGILVDYSYLNLEMIEKATSKQPSNIVRAIKKLLNHHCIEYHNELYFLNPSLRATFEHNSVFRLKKNQTKGIAKRFLEYVQTAYINNDFVDLSVVRPTILSALESGENLSNSDVQNFIQPSHFLKLARTDYEKSNLKECIRKCEKVWEFDSYLTDDSKVESVRLSLMSHARLGQFDQFHETIKKLGKVQTKFSSYTRSFCKAFLKRRQGYLIDAEKLFLKCIDMKPNSFAACRELAQIQASIGRTEEGLSYARKAYELAPNNPFAIDIFLRMLIEKASNAGTLKHNKEIESLLELLKQAEVNGKHTFYSLRMSQFYEKLGELDIALKWANEAVVSAPEKFIPRKVRTLLLIKIEDIDAAEADFKQLRKILDDNTSGEGKSYIIDFFRLRISLLIERNKIREAFNMLSTINHRIPDDLNTQLSKELADAVMWQSNYSDEEIINWAKLYKNL